MEITLHDLWSEILKLFVNYYWFNLAPLNRRGSSNTNTHTFMNRQVFRGIKGVTLSPEPLGGCNPSPLSAGLFDKFFYSPLSYSYSLYSLNSLKFYWGGGIIPYPCNNPCVQFKYLFKSLGVGWVQARPGHGHLWHGLRYTNVLTNCLSENEEKILRLVYVNCKMFVGNSLPYTKCKRSYQLLALPELRQVALEFI